MAIPLIKVCRASWEHVSKQTVCMPHPQLPPGPQGEVAGDHALPLLTLHVPTAGRGPHTQQGLLKAGWNEADEKLGRNSWEFSGTKRMPTYVPNTLLCILGAIKLATETWQGYEEQRPHKPAQGSADWVPLEPETARTRCDQCKLASRGRGWWMRWVGVREGGGMGAHIPCHKEQQKHRSGRAG